MIPKRVRVLSLIAAGILVLATLLGALSAPTHQGAGGIYPPVEQSAQT